jgi:hypothetical protein
MNFAQFAQDLIYGKLQLTDEQQRLAKIRTDRLTLDTNIGKGGETDATVKEALQEYEQTR